MFLYQVVALSGLIANSATSARARAITTCVVTSTATLHLLIPETGGAQRLVPVADPDVVRSRGASTSLSVRLETHQERRPLGAAVVHELHSLLPALMRKEHDRV